MRSILVVDDETNLRHTLAYALRQEGYEVVTAEDGETALELFKANPPELVILDLMLPKLDGLEVCRRIRRQSDVPILMLTARDSELDRVVGLEIGADDYLVKPFSMRELVARVRAMLRRATRVAEPPTMEVLDLPGLRLDVPKRRVPPEGPGVPPPAPGLGHPPHLPRPPRPGPSPGPLLAGLGGV